MIEHLEDSLLGDYLPTSQYQNDLKNEKFLQLKSILKKAEISLRELLPQDRYKIKHRTGQFKNIALSPWIGIHSKRNKFYLKAEEGIYLTLLWKVDGSGICVSLQMGTNKKVKPKAIRPRSLGIIKSWGQTTFNHEIDLASHIVKTRESRPWRYEQANIEGKEYDLDSLAEIRDDLPLFLRSYESLIDLRENGCLSIGKWHFSFEAKPPSGNADSVKRKATEETVITHLHIKIQKKLFDSLVEDYGVENVSCERPTTSGRPADILVQVSTDLFEIYEIKTAKSPRDCVRQALGQLLEYSYWPGSPKCNAIWVVGPNRIDDKTEEYIESLKSKFDLPIGYVHQPVEDSG